MVSRSRRLLLLLACLAVALGAAPGCKDRCRDSERCRTHGDCTTRGEVCLATEDADCRASEQCRLRGLCRAHGACVAGSDQDCQASFECQANGRCFARNDMCCTKDGPCLKALPRPPLPPGVKGEEGCPCGCDHSEAMAEELLAGSADHATTAIRESLAAITEREEAGYITPAMVEHRLRLLSVARERGLGIAARSAPPEPTGDNPPITRENGRLRAAADLVVHGEHSELVRGREKLLRAAFRVHLRLENLSDRPFTLARPEIQANTPFPIERWYVLGTDGQPWSGSLGARATVSVYVIGYMSSDVAPGDEIQASLGLDSLVFDLGTRARRKWYGLTGEEGQASCQGPEPAH